jgi:signal transduction histidine kinase
LSISTLYLSLFLVTTLIVFILIGIMLYLIRSQRNADIENKKLREEKEKLTFELGAQLKSIRNLESKLQLVQKYHDQAQKEIQERNVIFSDTNLYLEREVRKQTEEIRQANNQLQKVIDELDMFIYRTAHDIRGPLARLLGLAQIALMDVKDEVALDYIRKLGDEARNLNNILARLTLIYEINHADIIHQVIKPGEIYQAVLVELSSMPENQDIDFRYVNQQRILVSSDQKLFQFILKNLLENAIRFRKISSAEPSFIEVSINKTDKFYFIEVKDNGIGISPADAYQIFDMFSRAAGIHKTTGLGLYMTKLSVEKLKGNIELVRNKSDITHFRVSLPV